LNDHVGRGRWETCSDIQPGRDATAFYFETLEDAVAFRAAFDLDLLFMSQVDVPGLR
jgi:hypothetical protein